MHPQEDISLEELRARQPKIQARLAAAMAALANPQNRKSPSNNGGALASMPATPPPPSLAGISPTGSNSSSGMANAIAVSTAMSKAQEVSSYHSYRNHSQYK